MEKNMTVSTTHPRLIDAVMRRHCEARAIVVMLERDAIAAVAHDPTNALRLAWLASELRADLLREVASC
jgi:hypothetical protein